MNWGFCSPPPNFLGGDMKTEKHEALERRKQCRVAEQQGRVWWGLVLDEECKRRLTELDRPQKRTEVA